MWHRRGLWLLAIVLLGGLVSWGGLLATAQESDSSIQVGVVILGTDGQPQPYCVTLDGPEPNGADALQATGQEIVSESGSGGLTVCRIGSDGCNPPGELCFCQCAGGGPCAYWAYFHLGDDGNWQYSSVGAGNYVLKQGDVDGWWWRDNAQPDAPRLPAITFDEICPPQTAFPRIVTDGLGREVAIPAPPQRIASVTLGSDEILLEMVGPERLLGVTYFAVDPGVSNITGQLDGILHTDLNGSPEALISLDADLVVLAAYNNPAALDQLLDANVPVFVLADFNTLDDVRANIRLLGQATGEEDRAEAMIAEMDGQLSAIQAQIAGQEPVRVLYYEPGGVTYGPGSTVDEIITLAGGVNIAAEAGLGAYPLIDAEFMLAADPDVILLSAWFSDERDLVAWFTDDPAFSTLRAVQQGRVVAVSNAHMTNVSQYVVRGVEDVARALYPEVFADGE